MAGMERFTQRARRVLSLAHQEAEKTKHSKIDTGHLLIGLIDEEGGVASRALRELSVTSGSVRQDYKYMVKPDLGFDPSRIELGNDTIQSLELAVDEARRIGHHYIGTEHILLGLTHVEGVAVTILLNHRINMDQVRRQVRRILNDSYVTPVSTTEQNATVSKRIVHSKDSPQVFIVHGHDNEAKETVARYVENIGLKVVILNEQASRGKTIIEKFEGFAESAAFAIVLLTPDDFGYSKSDPHNIKFRARQNVVYELGYFNGKLGRNRVCALFRTDPKGEIELPSDFLGVVYVPFDDAGIWRLRLAKELKAAGLNIIIENIL